MTELNPFVKFVILAVCIGIVLSGCVFIGAALACKNGGGTLSGLTCRDVEIIGACEMNDKLYIPQNYDPDID